MIFPLWGIPSSLSDAADILIGIASGATDILLMPIATLLEVLVIIMAFFAELFHDLTVGFLTYTPHPGRESGSTYIFRQPSDESDIFHGLMEMSSLYMESIGILIVILAIATIMFLRIFDVALKLGLETGESQRRLFMAPFIIVLWIPIANILLLFAAGMTDFFQNTITFPADGIENMEEGEELDYGAIVRTMAPEAGFADVMNSIAAIVLATFALAVASIIYVIAVLAALLRVFFLYFIYAAGGLFIAIWAVNIRDLSSWGGKGIRWFVMLSLMPLAVVLLELFLPVFYASMTSVFLGIVDSMPVMSDLDNVNAEEIAPDEILASFFIILVPIIIGILPWGMVFGMSTALKAGAATAGVATLATGVGAVGGAVGASRLLGNSGALSGITNQSSNLLTGVSAGKGAAIGSALLGSDGSAEGEVESRRRKLLKKGTNLKDGIQERMSNGLETVSDDISEYKEKHYEGTGVEKAANTVGSATKQGATTVATTVGSVSQKGADVFDEQVAERGRIASSFAKKKYKEAGGFIGLEEKLYKSRALERKGGIAGTMLQNALGGHIKGYDLLADWDEAKAEYRTQAPTQEGLIHSFGAHLPLDDDGNSDLDSVDAQTEEDAMVHYSTFRAFAKKLEENDELREEFAVQYYGERKGYSEYKKNPEKYADKIDGNVMADATIEAIMDEDLSLDSDVFADVESAEEVQEMLTSIDRETVVKQLKEDFGPEYILNDNMKEAKDKAFNDNNSTIQNPLVENLAGRLFDMNDKVYNEAVDSVPEAAAESGIIENTLPDEFIVSEDQRDRTKNNVLESVFETYLQNGGTEKAVKLSLNEKELVNVDDIDTSSLKKQMDEALEQSTSEFESASEIISEYKVSIEPESIPVSDMELNNRMMEQAQNINARFEYAADELSPEEVSVQIGEIGLDSLGIEGEDFMQILMSDIPTAGDILDTDAKLKERIDEIKEGISSAEESTVENINDINDMFKSIVEEAADLSGIEAEEIMDEIKLEELADVTIEGLTMSNANLFTEENATKIQSYIEGHTEDEFASMFESVDVSEPIITSLHSAIEDGELFNEINNLDKDNRLKVIQTITEKKISKINPESKENQPRDKNENNTTIDVSDEEVEYDDDNDTTLGDLFD